MGIASVVLGVLAAVSMIAGFFLSIVPIVGAVLSFASPVLCLVGLVLGGMALSEAKRDGLPTGLPTAGVAICGVTFLPAVVVALTCGLCSACSSATLLTEPPGMELPRRAPPPSADPLGGKPPLPIAPMPMPDFPAEPPSPAEAPRPDNAPPPAFPPPPVEPAR
ncbi:MAG: hypothetical protein H5U40_07760 [Polyangiaceae bacterium]|nr:hypothetical protein [Polyangiaceae bacterium]